MELMPQTPWVGVSPQQQPPGGVWLSQGPAAFTVALR